MKMRAPEPMQDRSPTTPPFLSMRNLARGLVAVAALVSVLAPANAQAPIDCRALQAQIASTPPGSPDPRAVEAARRQREEISRTVAYADQIGCNRRQFLIFGSGPPPQCGELEQRIASMRGNMARLQAAVDQANAPRDALIARYNAFCARTAAPAPPRNFLEQLFGGGGSGSRELPIEQQAMPPEEDQGPRRGSKAVCVRTCDGYFFPVSYSAFSQSPERLTEMCRAQCPNAETEVYTYSPSRDITEAVSTSGAPYMSMKNALRYRKTHDPACTCRPPDKSWAETLQGAERLLQGQGQGNRRDMIVTPERAEELSRPRQPGANPPPQPRQQAPSPAAPAGPLAPRAAAEPPAR